MAIRFDDRIETNVAGDVLITGNQIAVSSNNTKVTVGTNTTMTFIIGTKDYVVPFITKDVTTLDTIPDAIKNVQADIYEISTKVIKPITEKLTSISDNLSNNNITINTTDKFFKDTLITGTEQLNNLLSSISTHDIEGKPIAFPIITLLSAPIQISPDNDLVYSSSDLDYPYGRNITIPKNTLIAISTTSKIPEATITINESSNTVGVLSKNIQILSMPVSADSIHNNFETRIANIESLLALGQ